MDRTFQKFLRSGLDLAPLGVVTSAGDIAGGAEIDYIDKNNLTISFAAAFSGKAYLN